MNCAVASPKTEGFAIQKKRMSSTSAVTPITTIHFFWSVSMIQQPLHLFCPLIPGQPVQLEFSDGHKSNEIQCDELFHQGMGGGQGHLCLLGNLLEMEKLAFSPEKQAKNAGDFRIDQSLYCMAAGHTVPILFSVYKYF